MTVGVSHDCPHLIGSDRILSLMPRNSTYFRQTYSFYIRLGTRLPKEDDDDDDDDDEQFFWEWAREAGSLFVWKRIV